ncbi:putative Phospho-N-acetylmuramoyl-pentapeptide-transferase [Hylemonella gracilis ATCC 19624]|uniref:Putative Phospho-N-acetylmuramoyl-pentapeptide-transferase n=1 Tax=Hylemonella gracilis ATCC 19624 TaxID=887062 RepID=F3KPE5_9BURK|nr:putative Phospho-N-acetylmuramoyl-pentapeptide-transferase [Hylemonella gracilis ATCC 19624]
MRHNMLAIHPRHSAWRLPVLPLLLLLVVVLGGCGTLQPVTVPADARPEPGNAPTAAASLPPAFQGADASAVMPLLRLPPSELQRTLALEQRIVIEARDENQKLVKRQIEVVLEADASTLHVVVLYMGQTAAVLDWDGTQLREKRSIWWPSGLSSERVLSELQLALWPAESIRAALPAGWTLKEEAQVRLLQATWGNAQETVVRIQYQSDSPGSSGSGAPAVPAYTELLNLRDGYRLTIRSRALDP